jgi:hypothetical protein
MAELWPTSRESDTEAMQAKMLAKVEARRIAVNISRLPVLLGRMSGSRFSGLDIEEHL